MPNYTFSTTTDGPIEAARERVIAALGDQMLKIAGTTAAGTILWMTGPKTIEDPQVLQDFREVAGEHVDQPLLRPSVGGLQQRLLHQAARDVVAQGDGGRHDRERQAD